MALLLWSVAAALRRLKPVFHLRGAAGNATDRREQDSIGLKAAGKVEGAKAVLREDSACIIGALSNFAVYPYFPIAWQFAQVCP